MAELIDKGALYDAMTEEYKKHYAGTGKGYDFTIAMQMVQNQPTVTTTEAEIRNRAIDEFAEKLKSELLLSKNVISERRKMCESGSHMEGIYSSAIGTLNGVYSMVDEVAEQLKGE